MVHFKTSLIALASVSALLAACGAPDNADDRVAASDVAPIPDIELTTIQEASFERFNRDEFKTNYMNRRQELMADGNPSLPADKAEHFSFLDRNDDDRLSAAEYALMSQSESDLGGAMSGANEPMPDDQIETVLRRFFSLDTDGNSMLSEEELGHLRAE